ncbi:lipopolysaccharide biosynthesis protein [Stutzerimonas stutzeri]|uniref:lipopolysaccharide biosynthesis protein n=1 Tax=Stutzerimonas stutzeri TaxID=316 RepID=UPI0026597F7E|nr:polysaccharide biosynthesis C-terminal domain-containing protein [Stutzerimonas stutzeri]MCF6781782.1 polysaccharide biosynthesis C-terminal domain-containing protein [Stutzerimonas stutzeri]MCF6804451.1 polysaccharide biosynthesis C-terminal domain-containing protein [Stutzerimonas stutzeri]
MSVIKNSFIYMFSSVASKGAPFLLLPFLTSYLQPSEFGVLAIFLVMNSLYGAFIGMALHANVTKNFFSKTKEELAIITGNIFFILVASTVLYFIVSLLIAGISDSFFAVPSVYLLVLPLLAFLSMLNQIHLTFLRNEGRAYIFGMFEIASAFLALSITLVCLLRYEMGWHSQVIGMLMANFTLAIIGVGYLYKRGYLYMKVRKGKIISILRISVPLIPHILGGVIISVSDRFFIEKMVGLEAVAVYSIGYSFGMVVSLLTDAMIKAWSPWFYKQLAQPSHERKLKIVKSTYAYLLGVVVVTLLVSVIGIFILPYAVEERYFGASVYIGYVALGYAAQGIYKIFFPYLVHINRTQFLAISTVFAAIINIIFNFIFIDLYGAVGAAYATILAFSISAILVFEYQRRNFPMPWFSFKNE